MVGVMGKKLLRIDEIIVNPEIYPREQFDPSLAEVYKISMDDGEEFPPILVGHIRGIKGNQLVDGRHRMAAHELRGETYVSVIVRRYESEAKALIDAVKLNSRHGRPLSLDDRTQSVRKLVALGVKKEKISRLVRIPTSQISRVKVRARTVERQVTEEVEEETPTVEGQEETEVPEIPTEIPVEPTPAASRPRGRPRKQIPLEGGQVNLLRRVWVVLKKNELEIGDPEVVRLSKRILRLLGKRVGIAPAPAQKGVGRIEMLQVRLSFVNELRACVVFDDGSAYLAPYSPISEGAFREFMPTYQEGKLEILRLISTNRVMQGRTIYTLGRDSNVRG